MKVLCISYREWAIKIYDSLEIMFPNISFKVIRSKEEYNENIIYEFKPDLILWYGWSWIINEKIIENYFCVMLHPSPLPKYRGGSPIQNQIINGEKFSKVTLFKMTKELDAGPIICQLAFSLAGNITDIFQRLTTVGIAASNILLTNDYTFTEQDHSQKTVYKRLTPDQSEISIKDLQNLPGEILNNKIRMLSGPYPSAYISTTDGRKLKLIVAEIK